MNEDELKLALKHVKRDERHLSNAETRYWCDQYKLLATQAIEALTQPEQEPAATVVARQYEDGTYAGNALDWAGRNCEDDLPVGTKLYTSQQPKPEQEPVACVVGMKGSAFDLPETKRAYTYAEQPSNVVASKIGRACNAATQNCVGDSIDRGLGLLLQLQKEGFGVFDLGAEYTAPQPVAPPETRPATREEKIARPSVYKVPVARVTGYYAGRCVVTPLDKAGVLPDNMALYAEPQQRKPLTEDEIEAACGHNPLDYNQGFFNGVRFAEKTHL